ncbi:holo-[acyl-carrier protein] synthase [Fontimonas thermophila]|uniref:Holo-[acyl-carrier-protein] synthase n=1 Tax=Fontimonas thermophila TaxID=1076937 RepID=A0A1I2IJK9_9GAMM|nr:holo-ACP synthase [Fontimonas thermophila]SFF42434.1 holo-[acyl-carrier protein] synthase [Fontimonas thermophila]
MAAVLHGVGIDILRVERMQKLLDRHGRRLLDKLLCVAERRELRTRRDPARALAMCFAAKEAFVKALGTGFAGVGYKDAGVVREPGGRPRLVFSRRMQARLRREGIAAAHVSLSDDGGVVCACVVLEKQMVRAI